MDIFKGIRQIEGRPSVICTVGAFDGVHLGHRKIIETVMSLARERHAAAMIVTFDPIPKQYFGDEAVSLMTNDEKIDMLRTFKPDYICSCPFNKKFASLSREEYLETLIRYLELKAVVAGPDHHFGCNLRGDLVYLSHIGQQQGFDVRIVGKTRYREKNISSGEIRRQLIRGHILTANAMLGYPYQVRGKVVKGFQRGRLMGIPTLNIETEPSKLLPGNGVYCVGLVVNGRSLNAVCNIGIRPTFDDSATSIEVHVPNMKLDNFYGRKLTLEFIRFIRHERRFAAVSELVEQINKDIKECKSEWRNS